ncbi:MAG: hypothetical protein KGI37_03355 [Alphaproteobacteria bacterium]|nr:hypothetical protein [Alphaproteobacteria bacterium]
MTKKTEARCVGATLTVGFHAANPPLIWRFDLERNHSFTLALQGEDGDWELGVTSPRGDFYPVVHFVAREDAEEAFAKVEKILSRRRFGFLGGVARALLYVAVAALVITGGVGLFGLYASHTQSASPIAGVAAPGQTPRFGVPLPANQILQPPPPAAGQ